MNFIGHAGGAAVAGLTATGLLVVVQNTPVAVALTAGLVLWLGGQFPDLDIASIPARWFGGVGFLLAGALSSYGIIARHWEALLTSSIIGMAALLLLSLKHRGPLHKYWLPVFLVFLGLYGVFPHPYTGLYIFMFAIGIVVHLNLDGVFFWSIRKGWLV